MSLTIVEASAGTGKTHKIEELVARFVLEDGVPVDRILAVTFTRAATAEMRDRLRRRLQREATLAPVGSERRARAVVAVRNFDAATITTIHGFCSRVLRAVGSHGGGIIGTSARDGLIVAEAVNDELIRLVADAVAPLHPAVTADWNKPIENSLLYFVRTLLTQTSASPVSTADDRLGEDSALWARLVSDLRDEVGIRHEGERAMNFDELVRLTHRQLGADSEAAALVASMYDVVLVDEFQDTDLRQWQLFQAAFLPTGGDVKVVVVGDPKQSIYGFRGADVTAYLTAKKGVQPERLSESWRASPDLLKALNLLLKDSRFGHDEIEHHDLASPSELKLPQINRVGLVPLQVRALSPEPSKDYVVADAGKTAAAHDAASVVHELLRTPATDTARAPQYSDIAVLVRMNDDAQRIAEVFAQRGIPVAQFGGEALGKSRGAEAWRQLLEAVNEPTAPGLAAFAAIGPFIGWTPQQLSDADDDALASLQRTLEHWRVLITTRGVGVASASLCPKVGMARRVLEMPMGQRLLTDIEHIGDLLQARHPRGVEPRALLDSITELAEISTGATEQQRRIDSGADAVRVMTIHASKGLEFPFVLLPFEWAGNARSSSVFHLPDTGLVLDVSPELKDDDWEEAGRAAAYGDDQRTLYVALTRAQLQVVVWWAAAHGKPDKALRELLFDRSPDRLRVDHEAPARRGDLAADMEALHLLATASEGTIGAVEVAADDAGPSADVSPAAPVSEALSGPLDVCSMTRSVDTRWRRHSFSSVSKANEELRDWVVLERDTATDAEPAPAPGASEGSLLALKDGGKEFGVRFHSTMERLDFTAGDLDAAVKAALEEEWSASVLKKSGELLARGISEVLHSPTGRCFDDRPLRELKSADRLNELDFRLPLATGGAAATQREIGAVMLDHLPDADPFRGFAEELRAAARPVDLVGYLIGSLDLVARVRRDGVDRFVISDYKTNQLFDDDGKCVLAAYEPARMPAAMVHHGYPLQIVLYSVALHRYLRWRLSGYRPTVHLGGAAYFFVRGMVGSGTPTDADGQPFGVCSWVVPSALTVALSDVLDGGL